MTMLRWILLVFLASIYRGNAFVFTMFDFSGKSTAKLKRSDKKSFPKYTDVNDDSKRKEINKDTEFFDVNEIAGTSSVVKNAMGNIVLSIILLPFLAPFIVFQLILDVMKK